jgi:hypothetical protein
MTTATPQGHRAARPDDSDYQRYQQDSYLAMNVAGAAAPNPIRTKDS